MNLVKTIGEAARNKETKIILGTVGLDLRSWFLQTSGLPGEQVTKGLLGIQSYPTKAVTLPVHAPTSPELVAQADLGYIHCFDYGFVVDDSSPAAAEGFAKVSNEARTGGTRRIRAARRPGLHLRASGDLSVGSALGEGNVFGIRPPDATT